MNIALWIVQILLALAFGAAGMRKITQPIEKLATSMEWVKDFTPRTVRLIGVLELLGAIGLILPAVTGIWPWLTPLAAVGLVLTMVGAMIVNVQHGKYSHIGVNIALLVLAAFVVFGRFVVVPL